MSDSLAADSLQRPGIQRAKSLPLIVEFAGLSGSGKTTAARAIIDELRTRGHRCCGREPLLDAWRDLRHHRAGFTAFCVRNLKLTTAVARLAARVSPLRGSHINYATHLLFISYYLRSIRNHGFEVIVLDQSWVQTIWGLSIGGRLPDGAVVKDVLRRFVGGVTADFGLVWFEIAAADAAERIRKRNGGASRFDRLDPAQVRREFTRFGVSLRTITSLMEEATNTSALTVDACQPPARVTAAILEFITPKLQASKMVTKPDATPPTLSELEPARDAIDALARGGTRRQATRLFD